MKSIFLIAIVAVAMIGVMVPSVFSQMGSDGIPCGGQWEPRILSDGTKKYLCVLPIDAPRGEIKIDVEKDTYQSGETVIITVELIDNGNFGESGKYGEGVHQIILRIIGNGDWNFLCLESEINSCYSVLIPIDSPITIEFKPEILNWNQEYKIASSYQDNDMSGYHSFSVFTVKGTEPELNIEDASSGGGCLIATATYGSEMATEVQQLRELRDNQLLNTESGTAFMSTFNDIYYSFSPIIADYERENPLFKEAVKITITPMISSLSLMENANSESEVISLGLSVIMLNLGMYLGVPAVVIVGIKRRF
ncbi:copper-binding protein [Nitrosopumilus sp.]|nr:copper-binding protein [Nitrosopumilus sp.]